ncbi:alkaline phosphatase family protein [Halorussus sp. MSC15.2]|uniref:alkaline phosphatase family protein n=1 Tax=Halorussus sp. MSC15.2 TaxID=2283638 RepID=UPI0013D1C3FE|nr:alkaline phosphatase family protein [Halorussus sp. MSC15.2]NEU58607.1 sulfatase-like hydrolase/transferase [Halorussus sp. MSC15.2]
MVLITVDCLRWDYHDAYRELYPDGVWYRGTPQATYTPTSHTSMFTGLNPPRHGVYEFGDRYSGQDTIFTATDSLSTSGLTNEENNLLFGFDVDQDHVPFSDWFPEALANTDATARTPEGLEESPEQIDQLEDYELAFLHDWILHGVGVDDEDPWHYTADHDDPAKNHEKYQSQLQMSIAAHETILEELKARDLYEDTLFVVWGDHGEALHEAPHHMYTHGHFPEEAIARVPIAFCSPQFDETTVDAETNARGIDIAPTLQTLMREAGLRFDSISHDFEGVDLTTFRGKLAGYTMSMQTAKNGREDCIRDSTHCLLQKDDGKFTRTFTEPDPEDGHRLEEPCENPLVEQRFESLYESVRNGPEKLILNHEPDREQLRNLGYID